MTKTVTTGKATDLITFTRASTGTYLDSVKYGDELINNGDFSNGAQNWTEEHGGGSGTPSASIANGVATLTGFAFPSHASIVQVIQTVAGATYRYSANITDNNAFLIAVNNVNQSGIITYSAPKSGVITITFVAPSDSTKIILRSQDANGTPSVFDNVSVKQIIGNQGTSGEPLLRTADTNEHRIEYDADGNLKGLLIEEQRANMMVNSGSVQNWVKTNVTMTDSVAVAPDGTVTADKAQRTDPNNAADYRQTRAVTVGNDYTFSIFAKADAPARIELDFSNSRFTANDYVRFNVDTGTLYQSGTGATYSITDYGNGWYRFSLTATCTASGNSGVIVRVINNEPHYAWGGQFEEGSFPTSYIPTSGSTVTRTNDKASLNASLFEYNGNEGTTLIEFDKTNWAYSTAFPRAYSWGHGSQSVDILNEVYNYGNSSPNSGKIRFRVDDAGGAHSAVFGPESISGSQSDNTAKVALALKDNDMAIAWKGTVVFTDTTGSPAIDLVTKLYIGSKFVESSSVVTDYMNGHIKSIKYYPVRLTNDEIKALTL